MGNFDEHKRGTSVSVISVHLGQQPGNLPTVSYTLPTAQRLNGPMDMASAEGVCDWTGGLLRVQHSVRGWIMGPGVLRTRYFTLLISTEVEPLCPVAIRATRVARS